MYAMINGEKCEYNNDKYLVEVLTLQLTRHFPFQTLETIKENMCGLFDQIIEGLTLDKTTDENLRKETARLKRKITTNLRILPKIRNRELLIKTIYNFLLSLDGLSTLNGFGTCNRFNDNLKINPEKESIRKEV